MRHNLKKDGDKPVEHANPNRHGNRPAHPVAAAAAAASPPTVSSASCASAAWRLANSRKPDTLLPGHTGAFSNGDRRRCTARAEFRAN